MRNAISTWILFILLLSGPGFLGACGGDNDGASVASGDPLLQFDGNAGDDRFSILWQTVQCFLWDLNPDLFDEHENQIDNFGCQRVFCDALWNPHHPEMEDYFFEGQEPADQDLADLIGYIDRFFHHYDWQVQEGFKLLDQECGYTEP